jgi:hypothetical protein
VLALGIVALLVVVAMAARSGHPGTSGHVTTRPVPNTVQDSFITLLVIAYIAVIVGIVVLLFRYRDRWHDPGSRWLANFVGVCALMLVATAVGYYGMTHSDLRKQAARAQRAQAKNASASRERARVQPVPARQARFEWPLALAVGGLVLLGGTWMYVRSRRRLVPLFGESSLESDLVSAIETTVDDLRSERDARKAVIAAYALMERTLTEHGCPRDRAEAPFEYLARILRGLRVRDGAVRRLTELFELAKFSGHPVDDEMREQAIAALLAIRDDLQQEEAIAA